MVINSLFHFLFRNIAVLPFCYAIQHVVLVNLTAEVVFAKVTSLDVMLLVLPGPVSG